MKKGRTKVTSKGAVKQLIGTFFNIKRDRYADQRVEARIIHRPQ